ncbi:MAG: hypothetical protein IAE80_21415 [Anaerolinea sp.]|nr:hypothetical protein [Anaerolinea sp.]
MCFRALVSVKKGYSAQKRQYPPEHPALSGAFLLFQYVKQPAARGSAIDATGEDFRAGLAPEALNTVVRTITDKGVSVVVGHATIVALEIRASKSTRVHRFLAFAASLSFAVGMDAGLGTKDVEL